MVNEKGVDTVWKWLFGKPSAQADESIEEAVEETQEIQEPAFLTRAEQIKREQAALKESGDPIVDEVEEKPFKPFFFF